VAPFLRRLWHLRRQNENLICACTLRGAWYALATPNPAVRGTVRDAMAFPLASPRQMISTWLSQMQIALTADRLFPPITETESELWILDNVDR